MIEVLKLIGLALVINAAAFAVLFWTFRRDRDDRAAGIKHGGQGR